MDGEWEAPQIPNPACETAPGCGTWKRPMVDNPSYKGKWKPPMIDNPNYQVRLAPPPGSSKVKGRLLRLKPASVPGDLEAQEDPEPGLLRGPAALQDDAGQRRGAGALVHDLRHLL